MKNFKFNDNVIQTIIDELKEAEKYIRIAIFQLHNKEVFEILSNKLSEAVKIEIITLPYDSINEDIKEDVMELFKKIEEEGAKLHFCKWNIGDPERTTTAVGRWYSFHGKFIVTDKSAIALSANFTQNREIDSVLIFKEEKEKVEEFNVMFDYILNLFINEHAGSSGLIREKILSTELENLSELFELPRVIGTDTHKYHWIKDYPSNICPSDTHIEDKLYVCPFDIKGRNLVYEIISNAEQFVYISTESFTDLDFSKFLVLKNLKKFDIKILTGALSMDFTDRIQNMFRELLADNIKVRTTYEDLHAKLIITDKVLAVSSINLNKMNLGFKKTSKLWRENTETLTVCSDTSVINDAKSQFLNVFNSSKDISDELIKKMEKTVGNMFSSIFGLKSKKEVKNLFAKLILHQEIMVKQFITSIGKITSKLMSFLDKKIIGKDEFFMSIILYYLTERKHDFDQINEKLNILNTDVDLNNLLSVLLDKHLIKKEGDFFKIELESLF